MRALVVLLPLLILALTVHAARADGKQKGEGHGVGPVKNPHCWKVEPRGKGQGLTKNSECDDGQESQPPSGTPTEYGQSPSPQPLPPPPTAMPPIMYQGISTSPSYPPTTPPTYYEEGHSQPPPPIYDPPTGNDIFPVYQPPPPSVNPGPAASPPTYGDDDSEVGGFTR